MIYSKYIVKNKIWSWNKSLLEKNILCIVYWGIMNDVYWNCLFVVVIVCFNCNFFLIWLYNIS